MIQTTTSPFFLLPVFTWNLNQFEPISIRWSSEQKRHHRATGHPTCISHVGRSLWQREGFWVVLMGDYDAFFPWFLFRKTLSFRFKNFWGEIVCILCSSILNRSICIEPVWNMVNITTTLFTQSITTSEKHGKHTTNSQPLEYILTCKSLGVSPWPEGIQLTRFKSDSTHFLQAFPILNPDLILNQS